MNNIRLNINLNLAKTYLKGVEITVELEGGQLGQLLLLNIPDNALQIIFE